MSTLFSLLNGSGVPAWVSDTFPIIRIVLIVLIAILALAIVVIVLIQPGASDGVNPITGQSETFYGKNKSKTLEGLFRRLTVIFAITIAVLAVLFFVTVMIYTGF